MAGTGWRCRSRIEETKAKRTCESERHRVGYISYRIVAASLTRLLRCPAVGDGSRVRETGVSPGRMRIDVT